MAALAKRRLKELDRLRDFGFKQIERFNAAADSVPRALWLDKMLGSKGEVMEFERLARTIRQIMVLEFEIRGLFEAPDRDAPRRLRLVKSDRPDFEPPDIEDLLADLRRDMRPERDDVRPDYRTGPLEDVVAEIRKVLGAEPPEDDPFAPPAKPKTAEAAPPGKLPPATVKLPEKPTASQPVPPQKALALKAAIRAIKATGGNGFRTPSKKSRAEKARTKEAQAKHRQGRAPPG